MGSDRSAHLAFLPHRCLVVRNERIINNSVARLRPHHAAALLGCAVERLRARGTERARADCVDPGRADPPHRLPHGCSWGPAHPSNTVTGEDQK